MENIKKIVEKIQSEKGELGEALVKNFTGGVLKVGYAGSGATVRSFTSRLNILDDLDGFKYSTAKDGDIVEALKTRGDTFGNKFKIYKNSTPTSEHFSQIMNSFLKSDQRFFFMPCPKCGDYRIFDFPQISIFNLEIADFKNNPQKTFNYILSDTP